MAEKKKPVEKEETSKKTEITIAKKKPAPIRKPQKVPYVLAPTVPSDLYQAFDDTFERFRSDFEDVIFPSFWDKAMTLLPETRIPAIDLEDNEKDYRMKAEMPGFKKEDIEIDVSDTSVVVTGAAGWKYDKKEHEYLCKERACKTFYRVVDLPEEIKLRRSHSRPDRGHFANYASQKKPKTKTKSKSIINSKFSIFFQKMKTSIFIPKTIK